MSLSLATIWTRFVERPLDTVGLFRSPYKRFAVVGAGTYLLLRTLKPESLYDKKGDARPSMFFSDSPHAVPISDITLSALIGTLSVLAV